MKEQGVEGEESCIIGRRCKLVKHNLNEKSGALLVIDAKNNEKTQKSDPSWVIDVKNNDGVLVADHGSSIGLSRSSL